LGHYSLFIADTPDEFFGTMTNVSFEDFVSVLSDPADMEVD